MNSRAAKPVKLGPASASAPSECGERSIAAARRVIGLEARALDSLSGALDGNFAAAANLLLGVSAGSRIIVSGMGKSGHVARKLAASLASTGTPAHFVHPGEASHGDLGMLTRKDALILLSNSGESTELSDLIVYAKRFTIPIIGISSRAESALMRAASIPLLLPATEEACPMGLAPTTSTTMMMALGDALVVALMELRGFSTDDYRLLHPGGRLGQALTRVRDIMHTGDSLPLAPGDLPMHEALLIMTSKGFGCTGVTDASGRLIGIITDGDLRRHMSDGLLLRKASEIMTPQPRTIRPDALVAEAVALMNEHPVPILGLFVVQDPSDKPSDAPLPVGFLHMHDCLRAGIK